jgi:tRNA(Phe) wybutosine-synthesizing methylase Tyw3
MKRTPFLNDPYDEVANHIAAAVSSPLEELRAMHIRAAEHLSEVAKQSGLKRSVQKL